MDVTKMSNEQLVANIRKDLNKHGTSDSVNLFELVERFAATLNALPAIADTTAKLAAEMPPGLAIGTPVGKPNGYGFPGVVATRFLTVAGDLRYVVEATGEGYAGMLHIFNPMQIERKDG